MSGYYWTSSNVRNLPKNAVCGGKDVDGKQIYIGKAFYSGDQLPAKIVPNRGKAYVSHGGRENEVSTVEVLCERKLTWVRSSNGTVPAQAVEGGRTCTNEKLYIGRVCHNGSVTTGKVHPSHRCLYIPFGGQELKFTTNYEILVWS